MKKYGKLNLILFLFLILSSFIFLIFFAETPDSQQTGGAQGTFRIIDENTYESCIIQNQEKQCSFVQGERQWFRDANGEFKEFTEITNLSLEGNLYVYRWQVQNLSLNITRRCEEDPYTPELFCWNETSYINNPINQSITIDLGVVHSLAGEVYASQFNTFSGNRFGKVVKNKRWQFKDNITIPAGQATRIQQVLYHIVNSSVPARYSSNGDKMYFGNLYIDFGDPAYNVTIINSTRISMRNWTGTNFGKQRIDIDPTIAPQAIEDVYTFVSPAIPGTEHGHQAFLKFNMTSLPSGIKITDAALTLNATATGLSGGATIAVYNCTAEWTEGSAYATVAGMPCTINSWNSTAALTTGLKYWNVTSIMDGLYKAGVIGNISFRLNATADTQGTTLNDGTTLKIGNGDTGGSPNANVWTEFHSREATQDQPATPYLNITYLTSTSISACTTLDIPGMVYNLTSSITNSATSYCINISTNNITLDCGGNTIDGNDVATYGIWTTNTSAKNFGNITIQNCKLTDWARAGIYLAAMDNSTLRWLNVSSSATNGIRVINSNNTIIEHIRTEYSNGARGIDMAVSSNFLLNNITSYGNGADGIRITGTSGAAGNSQGRVINTTILYNGGRGLRLDTLFNVYINNLNSSHNALAGMDFISADGSVLINSTINHNLREGIAGSFGADKMNISNNNIVNNSWAGISHQPTFGFRNAFIYNNFFNNSVNVNVSNVGAAGTATSYNFTKVNGTRVYGAGALLGGNYWANWTGGGIDFSQSCADANFDGFCDANYTLNINGSIITADYLPYSDGYDDGLPSFVEIPATMGNASNVSSTTAYFNITAFDLTTDISTCFLSIFLPGTTGLSNKTMTKDLVSTNVTCNSTQSFNPFFQGAFTWKFLANDSSNNWNQTSLFSGVFDSIAPFVGYTTLTPDNASTSTGSILVNATSGDETTGIANLTFTLTNITGSDMTELNRTFISGFYNYSLNFTSLASGTYLFNVTATDFAGNKNTTERRTVTISADSNLPIIEIISPTIANATNTSLTTFYFNATIWDATSSISFCLLDLDAVNFTMTKANNPSGASNVTCNYTASGLAEGRHLWSISANDTIPNGNRTGTFQFTQDTIKPFIDYIGFTPINNTNLTNVTSIYVNATSSDMTTGIANLTFLLVNISNSFMTELNRTFIYGFHNYTLNFTNLLNGTYLYNITASDNAGNKNTTERRTITINTTIAPAPPPPSGGTGGSPGANYSVNKTKEPEFLIILDTKPLWFTREKKMKLNVIFRYDNWSYVDSSYIIGTSPPDFKFKVIGVENLGVGRTDILFNISSAREGNYNVTIYANFKSETISFEILELKVFVLDYMEGIGRKIMPKNPKVGFILLLVIILIALYVLFTSRLIERGYKKVRRKWKHHKIKERMATTQQ